VIPYGCSSNQHLPESNQETTFIQKADLDNAVQGIMEDPAIGQSKTGDLSGILVYKFKMVNQLSFLAYTFHDQTSTLTLLAFGSHQNSYCDLKKSS